MVVLLERQDVRRDALPIRLLQEMREIARLPHRKEPGRGARHDDANLSQNTERKHGGHHVAQPVSLPSRNWGRRHVHR